MKRRPLADGEAFEALVDLYDPLPEIYEVHRCLEKACASGALRRVKGPIVARDMAEAIKKLRPEAKPTLKAKSPKGGE